MRRHQSLVFLIAAILGVGWASGVSKACTHKPPQQVLITSDEIRWYHLPKPFPPYLEIGYLQGDPSRPGPYTVRFRIQAHGMLPPHYHPLAETGTVITGVFITGAGNDPGGPGVPLPAGSIGYVPARVHHWARIGDQITVVQVHGQGPWRMILVNKLGRPIKEMILPPRHRIEQPHRAATGQQVSSSALREARASREAMTAAINARDASSVRAFVDPAFQFRDAAGNRMDAAQTLGVIDQMLAIPYVHQQDSILSVSSHGDTATIIIDRVDSFSDPKGKKVVQRFRAIETWKKRMGRWRAVEEVVPTRSPG